MKSNRQTSRRGFTILELTVTTAMLAVLTTSCMMLVRTSYTAWNRHEDDHAQRLAGQAVLQHIVRQTRQGIGVVAISGPSDTSGSLTLLDADGNELVWDHNGGTKQVLYGVGTATNVLATNIEELNFIGYKVDGSTETTDPGLIHMIKCTTKVNMIRPAGTESVSTTCKAWLRAW